MNLFFIFYSIQLPYAYVNKLSLYSVYQLVGVMPIKFAMFVKMQIVLLFYKSSLVAVTYQINVYINKNADSGTF